MKHLLIILISILLLSSPVIGDNHKGETLYRWGEGGDYKWMGFGDKETQPKYQGQVKDGKPNGLGILISPKYSNRAEWKYVGSWENGERNGQGTLTYSSGGKYVGGWKNGKEHGQGTSTGYGEKYVGSWKNGKKNGEGTETWRDGTKMIGEWKNDDLWNGTTTLPSHPNKPVKVVNGEYK